MHAAAKDGRSNDQLRLAWLLATANDPDLRDADRARELIETVSPDNYFDKPALLEVRAAVAAANGDATKAHALQQRAIDSLRELTIPTGSAETRLATYADGKPWREPAGGMPF